MTYGVSSPRFGFREGLSSDDFRPYSQTTQRHRIREAPIPRSASNEKAGYLG